MIFPLFLKSTFKASNSSESHPAPIPRISRPLLCSSIEATCFANITGCLRGNTSTAVPSFTFFVTDAANARTIKASYQGVFVSHVAFPSLANG